MVFVGVNHLSGTSKRNGEAYDFYQVQALSRSPRVEGFAVQTVNVSPQVWEQYKLTRIGQQFRATTDGYIIPLDEKLDVNLEELQLIL